MAAVVAYKRSITTGRPFQTISDREVRRLQKVKKRKTQRLEATLATLTNREVNFKTTISQALLEAQESKHRSLRMSEEGTISWNKQVLNELEKDLSRRRGPNDYEQLVEQIRAALEDNRGAGGFVEYGFPALLGLFLTWVWFRSFALQENLALRKYRVLTATKRFESLFKEVYAMSQSITVFSWPKEVIFGNNVSEAVGRNAAKDKIRQAMILTDTGVSHYGLLAPLLSSLSKEGIKFGVYDEVKQEVPDEVVGEAFEECSQAKIDLLIAAGGGSVIDTTKAVGILLSNGGKIQDYEGTDTVSSALPQFYVVPTTAGCGSEASQFCVVLDTRSKRKIEIISRQIIPQKIFIDPLLTVSMPSALTASTGIDALVNCIEAYFSTWASPLTDSLALHAIRLISKSLRSSVANGRNLRAREEMAIAAFEAGLAFTNAQSGAVHALGHSVTGTFNVPQRLSNVILLPHVMQYNMNANMDRMVEVAIAMGEPISGLSNRNAAEKAILAVRQLIVDIGLPTSFEEVGLKKEAVAKLSEQALRDSFLKTNPRIMEKPDIEKIYEKAFVDYSEAFNKSEARRALTLN